MTNTLPASVAPPAGAASGAAPAWWDRAAFFALAALLLWLPLPLASNRPWALAVMALAVWALLAGWLVAALVTGRGVSGRRLAAAAPLLVLLALCAALPALQMAAPALGRPAWATLDAFLTRQFTLAAGAYAGLALAVVLLVRDAPRALGLLAALVASAFVQALLAVALHAGRGHYLFLFTEFQQGGRVTGTFASPDHLAGFMELGLAAGLGLLLAQFGGEAGARAGTLRARSGAVLAFVLSRVMLLRLALVALVVALVMTHSRMGNGAFFLSLLLVGGLVAVVSRRLRRPALWLVASMAVVDIVIIGQWVGLDRLVERLQDTVVATRADAQRSVMGDEAAELQGIVPAAARAESVQDRLTLPLAAWPLAAERPWLGHGGGTFRLVAAPAKPDGLPLTQLYWDYAHNDYVQTAVETGYVGLALWLLIGLATAWRAARLLPDHQPRAARGVGVAALMALSCLALHSVVDFNLQIPANAATLVLLLALVWALPPPARRSRTRSTPTRTPATLA